MSKYFISYARKDNPSADLAQALKNWLICAGVEVFLDTDMEIGTSWGDEIRLQIDGCDYLIVLISESACNSEMVQAEVRQGFHRYKASGTPKLLPIRVAYHGELDYQLDSFLGGLQFRTWEEGEDHQGLLQELLRLARRGGDWSSQSPGSPSNPPVEASAMRPTPVVDLRVFAAPGGTQPSSDPFYVERQADKLVKIRAQLPCDTLVIKALRQMGKSSLLIRYLAACGAAGKRLALIDLSVFPHREMDNYGNFLSQLAAMLCAQLKIAREGHPGDMRQAEFVQFIEETVLPVIPDGGVVAFDEVDRILGRPYQGDFFSMLRSWHNSRASVIV